MVRVGDRRENSFPACTRDSAVLRDCFSEQERDKIGKTKRTYECVRARVSARKKERKIGEERERRRIRQVYDGR